MLLCRCSPVRRVAGLAGHKLQASEAISVAKKRLPRLPPGKDLPPPPEMTRRWRAANTPPRSTSAPVRAEAPSHWRTPSSVPISIQPFLGVREGRVINAGRGVDATRRRQHRPRRRHHSHRRVCHQVGAFTLQRLLVAGHAAGGQPTVRVQFQQRGERPSWRSKFVARIGARAQFFLGNAGISPEDVAGAHTRGLRVSPRQTAAIETGESPEPVALKSIPSAARAGKIQQLG
eukprot:192819-Chlamydomonas_euryale.AAC.6